jgi:ADP-ribose pyrophosphatase
MSSNPPRGRLLHQAKYLTLVEDKGWEFVTRHGVTGIVVLVAITPAREIVLVEQYRAPVGKQVIELPAGMVGDIPGHETESLAIAAHRELLEETGFESTEMVELVAGPIAVGVSDEVLTFFQARGLRRVGPGGGDHTENIRVHVVPLATLESFLAAKRAEGIAVDPKIFSGLYLAGEARPK